jgi:hypothetical protein
VAAHSRAWAHRLGAIYFDVGCGTLPALVCSQRGVDSAGAVGVRFAVEGQLLEYMHSWTS